MGGVSSTSRTPVVISINETNTWLTVIGPITVALPITSIASVQMYWNTENMSESRLFFRVLSHGRRPKHEYAKSIDRLDWFETPYMPKEQALQLLQRITGELTPIYTQVVPPKDETPTGASIPVPPTPSATSNDDDKKEIK